MPQGSGSAMLMQLMPLLLIFAIFYFILIRPQQKEQQKKQQEHNKMIDNLQKNDEIVTAGGIHGVVVNVKEHTVIMRIDDNAKMEVEKNAISSKIK